MVSVPDICPFSYYIKYSVSRVRSTTDSAPIMAPFLKINVLSLKSKSKEKGKDPESIQSSTKPDPSNQMGKWQTHKKIPHTRVARGQSSPSR